MFRLVTNDVGLHILLTMVSLYTVENPSAFQDIEVTVLLVAYNISTVCINNYGFHI